MKIVFVILVFGAIAMGSVVRLSTMVVSLRLREREDRVPAAMQLAAIALILGCCGAAFIHPAWLRWEAIGVLASMILYRQAGRYSRFTSDNRGAKT